MRYGETASDACTGPISDYWLTAPIGTIGESAFTDEFGVGVEYLAAPGWYVQVDTTKSYEFTVSYLWNGYFSECS
jgi:hypothetical protein